jgi:hypothetical protein
MSAIMGARSVRALALSATIMASLSGSAVAQLMTVDGNQLLSWCDTNINREAAGDWAMKGGTCLGYLTSIVNIQMSGAAVAGRRACLPPNANMNQIVDIFRAYMRDHPEKRHLLAANLAAQAFYEAFPCRP